ncbi:MAG: DUF131 domain-containing protein [Desulfurococcales archaeon]|uniref:DUF131 domain-containing protein n=1 Tax=Fervidicoccus fontis TaxID=683846 RepID=A0A7J3SLI6_9CREN|nr:DUF131 domain-containing protein [Desulfurococcales archaeon]
MIEKSLLSIGFLLIFIGFAFLLIGGILLALRSGGEVEGGGIIFIGPIPIVWGSSKEITRNLLIVAAVISSLLLIAYIFQYIKH